MCGSSALSCAVTNKNPECIRTLHLCFPRIDPNIQNKDGDTALMLVLRDYCSMFFHLHEFFPRMDPNIRNNKGETALMVCAKNMFPPRLLYRVFPNIDPNIPDKNEDTALLVVSRSRRFSDDEISQYHINAKSGTALPRAVEAGDDSLVALLLKRLPGAYLQQHQTNPTRKTALVLAIEKNNTNLLLQVLQLIIQID